MGYVIKEIEMIDIYSLQEELTELAESRPKATITEVVDWLCEDSYWLKGNIGDNLNKLKKLLIDLE